jgi:hypothetical protein
LIAQILMRSGFYMGSDLNESNDNLWFTLLMVRPGWFMGSQASGGESIRRTLEIFVQAMTRRLHLTASTLLGIAGPAAKRVFTGAHPDHTGRGLWPVARAAKMLAAGTRHDAHPGPWGWKEPNSHIYLEYLAQRWPDTRYIHVMRHGLDMAYSKNQTQLLNWGPMLGVSSSGQSDAERAGAALDYWIASNRRAVELAERLLGDRFLAINFDDLCARPLVHVPKLLEFVGVACDQARLEELAAMPRVPASSGRYRKHGLAAFSAEQLVAVADLGFSVQAEDGR